MKKQTRLTLNDLVARKEAILESRTAKKRRDLYIKSLDGVITIESPDRGAAREAAEMEDGDRYIVYLCVVEPCLKAKELREAYGCVEPTDIVDMLFDEGEIMLISQECAKLAGYFDGVKAVDELKNS